MVTGPEKNGGDPAHTVELLWRDPGAPAPRAARGPGRRFTLDEVLDAALALADTDGIDALTMRALAGRLGVTPMTLYTYVPGKADLVDLLLDRTLRTADRTPQDPDTPWRARVTAVAEERRALLRAHPWIAGLGLTRPPLGPGVMAAYEHELAAFEDLGLTDVEQDAALAHLLGFVERTVGTELRVEAERRAAPVTDAQWWAAVAPVLARLVPPGAHPISERVGRAAGEAHGSAYGAEHAWTFGLTCVLDGFEALVERRRPVVEGH
ncbi:TetR/AcrR family transcriptional regulator [Streptomyces sp. BI20]|uniref:TetR/AcrR family transcriptional regulator n=1 Tax=Streptomyces sp. BI20 TaxID=3403460 RepID=UPI003C71C6B5